MYILYIANTLLTNPTFPELLQEITENIESLSCGVLDSGSEPDGSSFYIRFPVLQEQMRAFNWGQIGSFFSV